ncbi:hypothetical protein [Telluribacter sp. SYSU D00476]|uniref:hypothetical protein n=1 Tax=Telluribacter sp. SYSU D00476 TaxID=2811430 RepID=UPI001FF43CCB|nr:hypothetical protein [Telluribacter sp. SYSU D00476]
MKIAKWTRTIFLVAGGVLFIFLTYGMYTHDQKQAYVQQHSPLVKMPIIGRYNGLGTLRAPNKIYVWHEGKEYTLLSPNRHFRSTAKADSIEVHFDAEQNIAVLPDINVKGPYFLYAVIVGLGVFMLVHALVQAKQTARPSPPASLSN